MEIHRLIEIVIKTELANKRCKPMANSIIINIAFVCSFGTDAAMGPGWWERVPVTAVVKFNILLNTFW